MQQDIKIDRQLDGHNPPTQTLPFEQPAGFAPLFAKRFLLRMNDNLRNVLQPFFFRESFNVGSEQLLGRLVGVAHPRRPSSSLTTSTLPAVTSVQWEQEWL
jgi:hypothetical protein